MIVMVIILELFIKNTKHTQLLILSSQRPLLTWYHTFWARLWFWIEAFIFRGLLSFTLFGGDFWDRDLHIPDRGVRCLLGPFWEVFVSCRFVVQNVREGSQLILISVYRVETSHQVFLICVTIHREHTGRYSITGNATPQRLDETDKYFHCLHCTMKSIHCTTKSIHCTIKSIHCTMKSFAADDNE